MMMEFLQRKFSTTPTLFFLSKGGIQPALFLQLAFYTTLYFFEKWYANMRMKF